MSTEEVKATIEAAIRFTGFRDPRVLHRPRLLSDNGPCYVSKALKQYLEQEDIAHTRGRPYHPMTQGKIERYHRSMKNILLLENYYSPDELTDQIDLFIEYYNNHRYHEALNNLTPADVYCGRSREILTRREKIKKITMLQRRRYNCSLNVA
jgi:transposase InsO family protein